MHIAVSLISDEILLQHMNYWKIFRFSTYHKYEKKNDGYDIFHYYHVIHHRQSTIFYQKTTINFKYLKQLQTSTYIWSHYDVAENVFWYGFKT